MSLWLAIRFHGEGDTEQAWWTPCSGIARPPVWLGGCDEDSAAHQVVADGARDLYSYQPIATVNPNTDGISRWPATGIPCCTSGSSRAYDYPPAWFDKCEATLLKKMQ